MKTDEKKLILDCSRINLSQEKIKEIRECANAISDWQNIFRTATFHGVCPLVYRSLKKACGNKLPKNVRKQFKSLYLSNAEKNLSISAALLSILQIFKENDIVAIPFKGPVLAEQVYGDVALRMFSDLDIFIKKGDAIRSKNILMENGYNIDINLSGQKENRYLELENSFTFYHRKGGPDIDLHWELTGRYLLKPIYLNSYEHDLKSYNFIGREMTTMPDDIMLIYLCIHGTSHCWERLEWLCSFSEMAQQPHIDLSNVLMLAETMGCKRMLYLGLLLSRDLLDVKIPQKVMDKVMGDRGVMKSGITIKKIIFHPKANTTGDAEWRFSPLHIHIRDSFIDRFKYAAYLYTTPTVKEWLKFPLPSQLTPAYRVMRPLRLGTTYLKGKRNAKRT